MPICRALSAHGIKIAPGTYWARAARPPSRRALADARITEILAGICEPDARGRRKPESLYGSLKMWEHLNRQGITVARCTVERLMRAHRWRGVTRARAVRTTTPDPAHSRAPDLVKRDFKAERPGQLHVADFTYVPLDGGGFGYTAFVIDVFAGLIAGWECSLSKETAFVEKAIRQAAALRARQGHPISGAAIHHSDAGSQGGFNWSSQHLDLEVLRYGCREAPAGDSCDARADVVARQAVDRAARGSRAVLGGDRPRRVERGCGGRDGCVAGRWLEVVPAGWRDAADLAGPAVGAVPVVR